jgi:hypothetical protein
MAAVSVRNVRRAAVAGMLLACGPLEGWDAQIVGPRRSDVEASTTARHDAATELSARVGAESPHKQILFGDLHVHSSYSWDGFLFAIPLVGGEGAHPPADACDFARHCASLDRGVHAARSLAGLEGEHPRLQRTRR